MEEGPPQHPLLVDRVGGLVCRELEPEGPGHGRPRVCGSLEGGHRGRAAAGSGGPAPCVQPWRLRATGTTPAWQPAEDFSALLLSRT